MDRQALADTVRRLWSDSVLPSLSAYVTIPALSPMFDPDWAAHGHLANAVTHVRDWLTGRNIPGATVEIIELPGRSPLLMMDVPATGDGRKAGAIVLYGHLDKQPPMEGWSAGLDAWTPVIRDGRLYGRGAADDGYSGYAAVTALEALRASGGAHARCVVLLETGEESGSPDLPDYLEHLSDRLDPVSLVICLDSGAHDYERLWLTTSLRGLVDITVTATVLTAGQHSGMASGIVPSSFRVLRALLDRVEDAETGDILLPEFTVPIPDDRLKEIHDTAAAVPGAVHDAFALAPGVRMVSEDEAELIRNSTWRATLSVTGAAGLPAPSDAGNVLRPSTTLRLSFRLPPTADSQRALAAVRAALTTDVPYNARIELPHMETADGWNAPPISGWLRPALDDLSDHIFGAPWRTMGIGGSIPFMALLHQKYPDARFVVTGVLGPDSNAHGPDESLRLDYAAKVTEAIAVLIDAHARTAELP